ncbi:MAG: hypothetical protein AB1397_07985 [bacterium]
MNLEGALSIILGCLISAFNLLFLLRSQKNGFLIFIKYILFSFVILFSLYLKLSPIFLAIGFALFPLFIALWAINKR